MGRSYWMPPWEGILTDAEVDGMIKYIRRLDPDYNPPPGEEGHRH
ncbi:cytochrome c [Kordiimonas gwangyangensis]|nr:cytochrome c [Kordiimonas gwangyangensis]